MCVYCEEENKIMVRHVISDFNWGWGGPDVKITEGEANRYQLGIFIDRGYLRFVDLDDCQCLEHGEKIRINYCMFCGASLT